MTSLPPLNAPRFDALTSGPDKLWGLDAIARALGLSVDTTRRLAARPDVPIYRPDGKRYFATRAELNAWLRTKSASRAAS
ncbi:helix-turn-helix domain-containing protein [Rubellimicrobium rubrum]|uniref:Helix-turn-helix domain-containing protein n=1 Tax=Rubellimicrobium rubrum TaxID=2585369 RepID=A0A5C4MX58_9RHOB|nr:helix-turn-helix domain-containing protein [Rubellimicrobium rubrum]TNC49308.1 helix-turn-helix domain-containing protein [Rubellimicrobium rubrum]